jgi:hypothetical protein
LVALGAGQEQLRAGGRRLVSSVCACWRRAASVCCQRAASVCSSVLCSCVPACCAAAWHRAVYYAAVQLCSCAAVLLPGIALSTMQLCSCAPACCAAVLLCCLASRCLLAGCAAGAVRTGAPGALHVTHGLAGCMRKCLAPLRLAPPACTAARWPAAPRAGSSPQWRRASCAGRARRVQRRLQHVGQDRTP